MDREGPHARPADLAPGDVSATDFDWSALTLRRVTGPGDPDFTAGYERLWAEFGPLGEMERRAVIEERLAWDPRRPGADAVLLYEMLVVRRGMKLIAVRDHTAVALRDARGVCGTGPVVVHLSHVFVEADYRGSGLAAWLRALPLEAARRCLRAAALSPDTPIVLVAEMEHPCPGAAERLRRLRAYERAGFQKVDPATAPYHQPDFRAPEELAAAPPESVPLALIVRRVGREREALLPAAELEAIVTSLYTVYGRHAPLQAIAPLREAAAAWVAARDAFALVAPTA